MKQATFLPLTNLRITQMSEVITMTPMRIKTIPILRSEKGRDRRFRRTLRFFAAKGYIQTALPPALAYRQKISTKDLLWSCEHVEPRLYQLIPAALLRFEGHFEPFGEWPPELQRMTESLKNDLDQPVSWQGFSDSVIKGWLSFPTGDRRSRRAGSKIISLRIKTETCRFLDLYCEERKIDRTEGIHRAIEKLKER